MAFSDYKTQPKSSEYKMSYATTWFFMGIAVGSIFLGILNHGIFDKGWHTEVIVFLSAYGLAIFSYFFEKDFKVIRKNR
jgi:FtsH-binding integral membrane protein